MRDCPESIFLYVVVGILTGWLFPISGQAQPAHEEIGRYVEEIDRLVHQALEASRAAEEAASVADVKARADEVYATVWGMSSGLADEAATGAARVHGWKERWQVTFADFDSTFEARYGDKPPEIMDPGQLGITGRGRYVREHLVSIVDDETAAAEEKEAAEKILASLNNVIGWMKMDDGVTKGERQPRVDLTREWDSPSEFWLSASDTGWLHEAASQALNILKTNYDGDAALAREHAEGMTELIEKYIDGVDANDDGTVESAKMEGGMRAVMEQARAAGYVE